MHDTDARVRAAAVQSFATVAPRTGAGPDRVLEAFEQDPDPEVRAAAVDALVSGWPDPNRLYPLFLDRLAAATSPEDRLSIGNALGCLPPPAVQMVPALIDALDPDDFVLRRSIPTALGKLGPMARAALPALAKAASRDFADPRGPSFDAAEAIAIIGPDSAEGQALLEPLIATLRQPKFDYQSLQAAWVLEKYGPWAAAAVPSLREALHSAVANVRQRAAFVLGRIGPAAQPARQDLSALLHGDPDSNVRGLAAAALTRIPVE